MLARSPGELRKLSRKNFQDYTAATINGSSKIFSKPSKFRWKAYDQEIWVMWLCKRTNSKRIWLSSSPINSRQQKEAATLQLMENVSRWKNKMLIEKRDSLTVLKPKMIKVCYNNLQSHFVLQGNYKKHETFYSQNHVLYNNNTISPIFKGSLVIPTPD